jgi:PAB1-binding protein PBP1
MSKQLLEDTNRNEQNPSVVEQKYPRHPITMENTPEETIKRMRAFPERAAKLRELIRALREADTR